MRLSTKTTSISDIATLLNKAQLDELFCQHTCTVVVHSNKSNCIAEILLNKSTTCHQVGMWANQIKMKDCCKLQIRIDRDLATLSIQVHKGHLYQRVGEPSKGRASLRENLASVLLQTANWNSNQTL